VFKPPPVFVPNTPGEPAAAAEFVPVTAGVLVALLNVPTTARAAVGIKTIASASAPTLQVFFNTRPIEQLPVCLLPRLLRTGPSYLQTQETTTNPDRRE
jgi:hypothetical protein